MLDEAYITTQIAEEYGDNFDVPNVEPVKPDNRFEVISVRCDATNCSEAAFDTRETLKRAGWDITDKACWCIAHIF